MRSDLQESNLKLGTSNVRPVGRTRHVEAKPIPRALPPRDVDAALADEAMPILTERGSRRELTGARSQGLRRAVDGGHATVERDASEGAASDVLLRSLAEQLDLLHEQQREIRQLLNRAERRRIDSAQLT